MIPTHYLDIAIHSDLRDGYALQIVLAAVHSFNRRSHFEQSNSGYPLGIAFPFWVDPKFHANRMMGFGSTGPVVRIISSRQDLIADANTDTRLIQMRSIGELSVGVLSSIPDNVTSWVSYCRASDGESLTPSQQRRLAKRLAARNDGNGSQLATMRTVKTAEIGYLKLPLQSASTNQTFNRPVRRFVSNSKSTQPPTFDSWGFTKPGGTFPAF